MAQPATPPRHYTLKEYFALQEKNAAKYEYIEGEAFAVGGTTLTHNLIKGNLVAALRPAARRHSGRVLDESVLLVVRANAFYTYPDVLLTVDPADRRDPYLVRHPLLLAEVLSPATAEYDRTEKFANYQQLPSLRHYLLISQSAWVVEWFRRDEAGQWVYTLLRTPESVLDIPDLDLRLPLRELYEDTDVAPRRVLPGLE